MRHVKGSVGRLAIPLIALVAVLMVIALPNEADAARRVFDSHGSGSVGDGSGDQTATVQLSTRDGVRRVLRVRDDPGDTGGASIGGISKRPRYTIFGDIILAIWNVDGARVWQP